MYYSISNLLGDVLSYEPQSFFVTFVAQPTFQNSIPIPPPLMHLFLPLIGHLGLPWFHSKDVVEAADLVVPPQRGVNLSESFECVITPGERFPPSLVESSQEVLIREAECWDKGRGGQKLCQA